MKRHLLFLAAIAACAWNLTTGDAQEPKETPRPILDSSKNPRLFDTLFGFYGYAPLKSIRREERGLRLRLPSSKEVKEEVGQTGIYSYVALAGRFDVEMSYRFHATPVPKGGYGMSCGLALDTAGPAGMLSLARSFSKDKGGSGYAVTRGTPVDGETKYETQIFPTKATRGRLALRRDESEVVCLATDDKGKLEELCRVPFTDGTVRQLRLYADPGGSPTALDTWVGDLYVVADEVTGGFPKLERRQGVGWWPLFITVPVLSAGLWALLRTRIGWRGREAD